MQLWNNRPPEGYCIRGKIGMLNWHEGLSTGVPDLDNHHKEIFQKFNEFYAVMARGAAAREEEAGKVLDYLQFYAQLHFQREEELMDKYHCPAAEENKREHTIFLKDCGNFYTQWQTGGMSLALANDTFVKFMDWLVNHIQGVDTQLIKYLPHTEKP
jgi:hemerythrin